MQQAYHLAVHQEFRPQTISIDVQQFAAALDRYNKLCQEAVRLATETIRRLQPILTSSAASHRLSTCEGILGLFELSSSTSRHTRRVELKQAIAPRRATIKVGQDSYGSVPLARKLDIVVQRDVSNAVVKSTTALRGIFGIGSGSLASLIKSRGAASEFLNLICRSDKWPRGFLPAGQINISAVSISLFGCKATVIRHRRASYLEAHGIDVGEETRPPSRRTERRQF